MRNNKLFWIVLTTLAISAIPVLGESGDSSTVQNILSQAFDMSGDDASEMREEVLSAVQKELADNPETNNVYPPATQDASADAQDTTVEIAAEENQDAMATNPAEKTESILEVAPMQADGTLPSVVFKGDVVDFIRFLSVTCNINIIPTRQVAGQISVNLFDVTCEQILDAVLPPNGYAYEKKDGFIYVYTDKEYQIIKEAERKTETRVFRLNYISTVDAEKMIAKLLSANGAIVSTPKFEDTEKTGDNWAGNNCMIVVDYPEYLEKVEIALKELDRRPAQILVEATILVVTLSDKDELGVDFDVLGGVDFQGVNGFVNGVPSDATALNGTTFSGGTAFRGNVSDTGLNIGIVKNNIGMFIRAIETTNDAVTLGNPKVLTLNRQPAEVRVGRDEGYITTETSTTTTTQSVQMLKTGTILRFVPFIMDDGYIRMELHPEDSSGSVVVKGSFALPEKTTTQVDTNILVKDGNTIVIGGLFRENTNLGRSQIPVAGNLPLIGSLFRSTVDENTKEEVIFLITPHIIKEEIDYAEGENVLNNAHSLVTGIRENMQWHSRERLAAAHYNQAMISKDNGKINSAKWHADMAVSINPAIMEARLLRDELRVRQIYVANMGNMHYFMQNVIQQE